MLTRRQLVLSAAAAVGGLSILQFYSSRSSDEDYEKMMQKTWQKKNQFDRIAEDSENSLHKELVRYATLAPSSHNTQCWNFKIEKNSILIKPDFGRRCPAVDPDDHHLFISLGCATENMTQAALAYGLQSDVIFKEDEDNKIHVSLNSTRAYSSPLFEVISERQCTRSEFDHNPLTVKELSILEKAATGKGVQVLMLTEKKMIENVLDCVIEANTQQMADPAFIKELKTWIRFNKAEALLKGDGLHSAATGNPALPTWLGNMIFGSVFKTKNENEKYAKQIRSSAGIAIFTSEANNKENWIEVGRCYERFALQSAALGIRNAFVNQPVEVLSIRSSFAQFLGIGNRRPDLIVRFGRGSLMPRSLRRPLEDVII